MGSASSSLIGLLIINFDSSDEFIKAGAYMPEVLTDPKTALSEEGEATGLALASGISVPFFDFLSLPEKQVRGKRFASSMANFGKLKPLGSVLNGTTNPEPICA